MRNFVPPHVENQAIADMQFDRQRRAAMADRSSAVQAMYASGYSNAYPWMEPGEVEAAVQAGIAPESQLAQRLSQVSGEKAAFQDRKFDEEQGNDVPGSTWDQFFGAVTSPIRGAVRTGFALLSAPFEETTAAISSLGQALADGDNDPVISEAWHNFTNQASPSALRLMAGEAIRKGSIGEAFDEESVGTGFFINGEIQQARQRMKQRLTLDGQFVTPGRLAARVVSEPGSTPYNLISGTTDFAANIFADPAIWATAGLSKLAKANKVFELGAVPGVRNTVDVNKAVTSYLDSDVGRELTEWLTKNKNVGEIWNATGKPNRQIALRLADSDNFDNTRKVLEETLGLGIREKPTSTFAPLLNKVMPGSEYTKIFGPWEGMKHSLRDVRLIHDIPGVHLDANDMDKSLDTLHDFMRNAKLDEDTFQQNMRRVAELDDGDYTGLFQVTKDIMGDTKGVLVKNGVDEDTAAQMTQLMDVTLDDTKKYFVDSAGNNVPVHGAKKSIVNGQEVAQPTPHTMAELINRSVFLPAFRDIRRATGNKAIKKIIEAPGIEFGVNALDRFMTDVWKPLQLARMAWTVRVIGEEQVRMAGAGLDSLVNHPMSALAWTIGEKNNTTARLLEKVVGKQGTKTLNDEVFGELKKFQEAMSRGNAGWRGLPGEVLSGMFTTIKKSDPHFYRGWATEMYHMDDPIMQRVAGGLKEADMASIQGFDNAADTAAIKEWFWAGTGKKFRNEMAAVDGKQALATSREVADEYIESYIARLHMKTGGSVRWEKGENGFHRAFIDETGNSELIDGLAKGEINGVRISGSGRQDAAALADELKKYEDVAPDVVKTEVTKILKGKRGQQTELIERYDKQVENMFRILMTTPTNTLSRSPAFRQFYWKRVEELMPRMDDKTQKAMLRKAREGQVGSRVMKRLESKAGKFTDNALDDVDAIDILAKDHSLTSTRELLYDLEKRGQWADITRNFFPFGEAWREIITSWSRLMAKRPQNLRRFQQGVTGARGSGFFHPQDPSDPNSREVFTYPGGELLSKFMLGTDKAGFELTGSVEGLNLVAGSMLPGFGPAVQLPANQLLKDKKGALGNLREFLAPFSSPTQGIGEQFFGDLAPAYAEKIGKWLVGDPESDRLYANTVMDVARALVRGGDYNTKSQQSIDRLMEDAKKKASMLWLIRGSSQFALPTGPSVNWRTTDKSGKWVAVRAMSNEYRDMVEATGGDTSLAMQEFIKKFGVDNVMGLQAKSRSVVKRPLQKTGVDWLNAHPEVAENFELTAGLLAPEKPSDEFDYDAYLRQFEEGTREQLTPEQMVALHNDFLGSLAYNEAKRKVEGRNDPAAQIWLAQQKDALAEEYPGFETYLPLKERPRTDDMVAELQQAVANPTVRETNAGKGLHLYLQARQRAMDAASRLPGNVKTFKSAKAARSIRDWLRYTAFEVLKQYPEFAPVYTNVFQREMTDDGESI